MKCEGHFTIKFVKEKKITKLNTRISSEASLIFIRALPALKKPDSVTIIIFTTVKKRKL